MEISNNAEQNLQQSIKEPVFKIDYKDGSRIMFSVADVVAFDKERHFEKASNYNSKNHKKYTYTIYLISGNEINLDEDSYNKLLKLKGWD